MHLRLLNGSLGVLNLRLVRLNCVACAAPYPPDETLLARLKGRDLEQASFRRGGGCAGCGFTGFRGRAPLTEFLAMNPLVEKLVAANAPAGEIERLARETGMKPLAESAIRRVFAGETTLEEVASHLG